jgi:hypothetical protein
MESKVSKNTSNYRSLSIGLMGNSVGIQQVLQQQILASITLVSRNFAATVQSGNTPMSLDTIPVYRLSNDTDILYRCAIALKLAPLWQVPALEIAHQWVDVLIKANQATMDERTGEGYSLEITPKGWKTGRGQTSDVKSIPPIRVQVQPHPSSPLSMYPSPFSCPIPTSLDFDVEVLFPGWIHFRLSDRALATWLQLFISSPAIVSNEQSFSSSESATKKEAHQRKKEESQKLKPESGVGADSVGQDAIFSVDTPDSTHPSPTQEFQDFVRCSPNMRSNLFKVQYVHARCCSLLRLAHRSGLITLNDPGFKTSSWQFMEPNPVPWLNHHSLQTCDESRRLRCVHPAERELIDQLLDSQDRIGQLDAKRGFKQAYALSLAFENFYSRCRIWGEVKTQMPELAQARLGLVGVTQKLLRSLLEDQLGVLAPLEL